MLRKEEVMKEGEKEGRKERGMWGRGMKEK